MTSGRVAGKHSDILIVLGAVRDPITEKHPGVGQIGHVILDYVLVADLDIGIVGDGPAIGAVGIAAVIRLSLDRKVKKNRGMIGRSNV